MGMGMAAAPPHPNELRSALLEARRQFVEHGTEKVNVTKLEIAAAALKAARDGYTLTRIAAPGLGDVLEEGIKNWATQAGIKIEVEAATGHGADRWALSGWA
jgi:hypothetical protein